MVNSWEIRLKAFKLANPSFFDAQYAIFGGKFLRVKIEKQKPKQHPSNNTTEELHNHDKSDCTVHSLQPVSLIFVV
ncbi:MAG: hypothetical protein ACYT04_49645, partial [Nostoc sp.]